MAREAVIGPAIYEEVNKLVADGKTRTEAFAAVAKKRKARDGTVAANYYRVARQQGATPAAAGSAVLRRHLLVRPAGRGQPWHREPMIWRLSPSR